MLIRVYIYKTISISVAILITGGDNARKSEVFLPWSNRTCELPSLPEGRAGHVQSGNMMCGGGWGTEAERSCTMWSAEQGGWVTLPDVLTHPRDVSSSWTGSRDHSLVILGGYHDDALETSDTVSSDGVSTGPSFNLKYLTR